MANKKIIALVILVIVIIVALFYAGKWAMNRTEMQKEEGIRSAQRLEEGAKKLEQITPKYTGLGLKADTVFISTKK